jgi:hypothetical protein
MGDDAVEVAGKGQSAALCRTDVPPEWGDDVVAVAGDQNANVI